MTRITYSFYENMSIVIQFKNKVYKYELISNKKEFRYQNKYKSYFKSKNNNTYFKKNKTKYCAWYNK